MGVARRAIYGDADPRQLPAYPVADVARYLDVNYHTLYNWLRPVSIRTDVGDVVGPLIVRPHHDWHLTFLNLIEAYVVKALTTAHNVPLEELRRAIEIAARVHNIDRPLISSQLQSGFGWVFIEEYGRLINLGKGGQFALNKILKAHLKRIEFDEAIPTKLFPFVKGSSKREVSISPFVAFGKPVVSDKAIRTSVIAQRFDQGESEVDLATDYGITEDVIEEAIIYECAA